MKKTKDTWNEQNYENEEIQKETKEVEIPKAQSIYVDKDSVKDLVYLLVKNGYHVLVWSDGISDGFTIEFVHPQWESYKFKPDFL